MPLSADAYADPQLAPPAAAVLLRTPPAGRRTTSRQRDRQDLVAESVVGQVVEDDGATWYLIHWRGTGTDSDTYVDESFLLERGVKNPILQRWLRRNRNQASNIRRDSSRLYGV